MTQLRMTHMSLRDHLRTRHYPYTSFRDHLRTRHCETQSTTRHCETEWSWQSPRHCETEALTRHCETVWSWQSPRHFETEALTRHCETEWSWQSPRHCETTSEHVIARPNGRGNLHIIANPYYSETLSGKNNEVSPPCFRISRTAVEEI